MPPPLPTTTCPPRARRGRNPLLPPAGRRLCDRDPSEGAAPAGPTRGGGSSSTVGGDGCGTGPA
eukprot:2334595-Alexandrium_andersonii.AAC.1